MKSFVRLAAGFGLFAVLLSGCGQTTAQLPDEILEPTLVISEEGQVTAYLVGEFDKAYYDLAELEAMAREEAAAFSGSAGAGEAPVTVESVKAAADGSTRVVVTYHFTDPDIYAEFIGNFLFYGTVEEAVSQGYLQGVTLQGISGGAAMTDESLTQEAGRHLIITDTAALVYCPYKVTHITNGAVQREDGSIDPAQTEGLVYVLMGK